MACLLAPQVPMLRSLFLLFALACNPAEPPAAPAPPAVPAAPPAAPEPPAAPAVALPKALGEGVPGWLAFGREEGEMEGFKAAIGDAALLVDVQDGARWEEVPVGTEFVAVGPGGSAPATFQGVRTAPYGCDNSGPRDLALFSSTLSHPGPLWLLPAGGSGAATAIAEEAGGTAKRRAWAAGDLGVSLQVTGPDSHEHVVSRGGKPVFTAPGVLTRMEGDESGPLDLLSGPQIGVPVPLASFVIGGRPLLVSERRGYEGVSYEVLDLSDPPRALASVYLYQCAF